MPLYIDQVDVDVVPGDGGPAATSTTGPLDPEQFAALVHAVARALAAGGHGRTHDDARIDTRNRPSSIGD